MVSDSTRRLLAFHVDADAAAAAFGEGFEGGVLDGAGEDRGQAAGAGLAVEALVDDVLEHRLLDHQLEALVLELADQAVEHVGAQDLHQRAGVERLEGDEAGEAGQQLGQEAVGLEVGDLLDLLGGEADGDGVGRLHRQRACGRSRCGRGRRGGAPPGGSRRTRRRR